MRPRGYFVAGTDTDVGKTHVTCGLINGFHEQHLSAGGMKPVLAGSNSHDVANIAAVSGYSADFLAVCTYRLRDATAPNIAAEREAKGIERAAIMHDFQRCLARQAVTVVEGTGGWYCPIGDCESMADVAIDLGLPVVLVVGLRLGCLNHTLLTVDAIARAQLPLAGWVANTVDPDFEDAPDNIAFLQRRLAAPLLCMLPHAPLTPATARCLSQAARQLSGC